MLNASQNASPSRADHNRPPPLPLFERPDFKLVFLDLETTGLVGSCKILEIACIVTDKWLNPVDEAGFTTVIWQGADDLENMNAWCQKQHVELAKESAHSKVTVSRAEQDVIDYLRTKGQLRLNDEGTMFSNVLLAGNNIKFDEGFLRIYMPALAHLFSEFSFDVTSVRKAFGMWASDKAPRLKKDYNHRALDDVRETIKEARLYMDYFKA